MYIVDNANQPEGRYIVKKVAETETIDGQKVMVVERVEHITLKEVEAQKSSLEKALSETTKKIEKIEEFENQQGGL